MTAPSVFFVAVEPSADLLAYETLQALRARSPEMRMAGIGGAKMADLGLRSNLDLTPLAVVGLFEGLKVYPKALELVDQTVAEILDFAPRVVVLVDAWGFTIRVAQRLKRQAPDIHVIKLVGPQVWATRPGRARTLAKAVDEVICIHAMEADYYTPFGLPVTVMGNPALGRTRKGDPNVLRARYSIAADRDVLVLFPGSRHSEIKRVAPALVNAAWIVKAERPDVEIIAAPAPAVRDVFLRAFPGLDDWLHMADTDLCMQDIMAGGDYALACSGTVTSELAVQGTPFLVGYKTGWMTYMLAKNILYQPRHITLLNIAADDQPIVPEFLQSHLRPELMAREVLHMLSQPGLRQAQIEAQNAALQRMSYGQTPAAQIAAEAILKRLC